MCASRLVTGYDGAARMRVVQYSSIGCTHTQHSSTNTAFGMSSTHSTRKVRSAKQENDIVVMHRPRAPPVVCHTTFAVLIPTEISKNITYQKTYCMYSTVCRIGTSTVDQEANPGRTQSPDQRYVAGRATHDQRIEALGNLDRRVHQPLSNHQKQ